MTLAICFTVAVFVVDTISDQYTLILVLLLIDWLIDLPFISIRTDICERRRKELR